MGREIHDSTVIHSSIALLQERFRQLQRVKEMREERELLQMLSTEPKHLNSNPTKTYEPTRLFFHSESVIPSRSPPHISLSLWPASQGIQENNRRTVETPVSMNLNFTDCPHTQALWKNAYDWDSGSDSGVDTSLHL
ncbi:uncharacterized protein LOC133286407 [Gastrolobium bilobum]|uniref:uncharacterized protein LOC133286407 n=1 Tax=Gastrolobium bilobum TaxID=150636 RepID=UPI002AAFEA12|nr:uncharacterized protein LOC133286407 [Gastrolobium bilobum]